MEGNISRNCVATYNETIFSGISSIRDIPLDALIIPCAYLLLSIVICTLNGTVLNCYARSSYAQNSTNFFIVQLAITDLTVGLMLPFVGGFYAVKKLHLMNHNTWLCVLNFTLFIPPAAASVLALLALTYDRYRSIMYPLGYVTHMTKKKARLMVVFGIWIPALTIGFVLPTLWHESKTEVTECGEPNYIKCNIIKVLKIEYLRYIFLPSFVLIAFIVFGLNVPVLQAIWKQHKRQQRSLDNTTRQHLPRSFPSNGNIAIKQSDIALLKTVLLIFGTFFVSWLPCIITMGCEVYVGINLFKIHTFIYIPTIINSACNPIIYAFRLRVFRKELSRRYPCLKRIMKGTNGGRKKKVLSRYGSSSTNIVSSSSNLHRDNSCSVTEVGREDDKP